MRIRRSALVLLLLTSASSCTPQGDPALGSAGYRDDFERAEIGADWNNTGGPYQIRQGALHVRGARNHPLWLRRALPRDVRVEFDVRSESPDGDIKCEIFGDGVSHAQQDSYTATSYVVIFGGWSNSLDVLARLDEHASDRVQKPSRRVQLGHTYRFKIERRGDRIAAWVDGEELVSMTDPNPLEGRGHDHFGFNNWDTDLTFDNLRITPL